MQLSFNISKSQTNVNATLVDIFCRYNGFLWLDLNNVILVTHADTNGHYTDIHHMLLSPVLVPSQQLIDIHVDDENLSDQYAISAAIGINCCNIKEKMR